MFQNNISFNRDLTAWDVSSVTDMSYIFRWSSFNGDISSWDASSVTDMSACFSVTTVSMEVLPLGMYQV